VVGVVPVRHRTLASGIIARMDQWLTKSLMTLRDSFPERLSSRMRPKRFRYHVRDVPPVPQAKRGQTNLYIAPANFAGQGYQWARAVERGLDVSAVNLTIPRGAMRFSSDFVVPYPISYSSTRWQRRHFNHVVSGFSHVLIEACMPLFGSLFSGDIRREVAALQQHGIRVGMISHGSEVRLPSRHMQRHPFSMFNSMAPDRVEPMERVALKNQALIEDLAVPWFVSTAGLVADHPNTTWLPVCIDVEKWSTGRVPLVGEVPVVVHAPSLETVKRSDLIDGALSELQAQGVIRYRRIVGVPNSEMPELFADADILLDSVGGGNYGVASCEGMASGLVVVTAIHSDVRAVVHRLTGFELPIVNTAPDGVADTILRIVGSRAKYQAVALDGVGFVQAVHDGKHSAEALRGFLAT
jgi:hypothetical protein